ncbi:MAG: LysR family transcriptional regulator [Caulobacteraceae bacterium]|nr:LysR family transcriptional regulator [Caulobacter sp.]
MDLLALADFNLVAAHGGFGRASRASGRPKATLSRRVAELEAALGVRLVERGAQVLRLTEAGRSLHDRTGPLLGEIAEAGADVGAGADRPRRHLRVSAPQLLSDTKLGAAAASFLARYPDVTIEIQAEDRMADPVADGFDLVIRINPRPDERLVGRCVMRDAQWLVAPPGWARPPEGGAGPAPLRAVMRAAPQPGETWRIHDGSAPRRFRPEPVMRLSTLPMVRDAVLAGAGAALLPRSLVAGEVAARRLACWGWLEGPATEVWALHTARRLAPPKVTAFVAHLAQTLAGGDGEADRPPVRTAS